MTSQQAPGRLELVRAFANTVNVEEGTDDLTTPEDLAAWLAANDLEVAAEEVDAADLDLARETRRGLRALIAATNHPQADVAAISRLDRAVDAAGLAPRFAPGEARLEATAPGVAGAMGRLLGVVVDAMADGTWSRLKLCPEADCAWAFYDHSRNRSGRWCTMAVCGNRAKARAYRARLAD